jgi:hypothetical protein
MILFAIALAIGFLVVWNSAHSNNSFSRKINDSHAGNYWFFRPSCLFLSFLNCGPDFHQLERR